MNGQSQTSRQGPSSPPPLEVYIETESGFQAVTHIQDNEASNISSKNNNNNTNNNNNNEDEFLQVDESEDWPGRHTLEDMITILINEVSSGENWDQMPQNEAINKFLESVILDKNNKNNDTEMLDEESMLSVNERMHSILALCYELIVQLNEKVESRKSAFFETRTFLRELEDEEERKLKEQEKEKRLTSLSSQQQQLHQLKQFKSNGVVDITTPIQESSDMSSLSMASSPSPSIASGMDQKIDPSSLLYTTNNHNNENNSTTSTTTTTSKSSTPKPISSKHNNNTNNNNKNTNKSMPKSKVKAEGNDDEEEESKTFYRINPNGSTTKGTPPASFLSQSTKHNRKADNNLRLDQVWKLGGGRGKRSYTLSREEWVGGGNLMDEDDDDDYVSSSKSQKRKRTSTSNSNSNSNSNSRNKTRGGNNGSTTNHFTRSVGPAEDVGQKFANITDEMMMPLFLDKMEIGVLALSREQVRDEIQRRHKFDRLSSQSVYNYFQSRRKLFVIVGHSSGTSFLALRRQIDLNKLQKWAVQYKPPIQITWTGENEIDVKS